LSHCGVAISGCRGIRIHQLTTDADTAAFPAALGHPTVPQHGTAVKAWKTPPRRRSLLIHAHRGGTVMSTPDDTDRSDDEGTPKPGGLGQDGTIPNDPDGIAAGHTGEKSTFEPEEDEQA